jgi:hypothetical protein
MEKIIKISGLKKEVENLNNFVELNYYQLMKDYSYSFDKKKLINSFLKQRLFARLLAFRSFQPEIIKPVLNKIKKKIGKNFYLAPLFYIRYCYPDEYFNISHKKALLYTEPHYDKYIFNNKGMTFWIPLKSTNKQSGTLCYLKKNWILKELFPVNLKNKFNIKNYLEVYDKIDPFLSKQVRNVFCKTGDVLYFDQNVLHGATGPITEIRLSLNFQVTFSKKFKDHKDFYLTNYHLKEKNLLNSLAFGDIIFYEKKKRIF